MSNTETSTNRSRALPEDPNDWTPEHDLVLFRKFQKLLAKVPSFAASRMHGYLRTLVDEAASPTVRPVRGLGIGSFNDREQMTMTELQEKGKVAAAQERAR